MRDTLLVAVLLAFAVLSAVAWLIAHVQILAGVALIIGAAFYGGRLHERRRARPGQVQQQVWPAGPAAASTLPAEPFRNLQCMPPGAPWWRWAARQIIPRRRGRACCWMHEGSWHRVSRTAIGLVRQAQRAGVAADDIYEHVRAQAEAEAAGVGGWELDALDALVSYGDGIQVDTYDDGSSFYINGQHKGQAMLYQGVRRTIVIRWQYPRS